MYFYMLVVGFLGVILSIVYLAMHKDGKRPTKQKREPDAVGRRGGKSLQQFFGFRRFGSSGTETESGTLAFYEIHPGNLTVLPEHVVSEQIRRLQMILQQEEEVELLCLDGSDTGRENLRFLQQRIAAEENPRIRELLKADLAAFEKAHLANTSIRQFYLVVRMQGLTEAQQERRLTDMGRLLRESNLTAHRLDPAEIRHMLGIYYIGYMYAEQWREDFYDSTDEGKRPESRDAGLPGEQAEEEGRESAVSEAEAAGSETVPKGSEAEGEALSADPAGSGETGDAGGESREEKRA